MHFDNILANPPYSTIGVDITKNIIKQNPDSNYAMLGTRSMMKKHYDRLACQYVQVGKYLLGTNENLHWVEQAILLATNGWTEVVDNRKKDSGNWVQVNKSGPYLGATMDRHTANVTDTKPTDVKLRNGYIYVAFETFEEACDCAIDIISWTDPTDSHYRCIRWGFVKGLVPHYKNITLDNIK